MKKEVLAILSVALVVVIVGCGLWLGWYALDSHHQKEAFADSPRRLSWRNRKPGNSPAAQPPPKKLPPSPWQ